MWVDVIGLLLLIAFALVGYWRGTLATGLKLLCLVGAYALSVLLAPTLAGSLSLPLVLGVPVAGTLVFIVSYFALAGLSWLLRLAERRWRGDGPRTGLDRSLGGVLGLARGGLSVLFVGWLCLWLEALRVVSPLPLLPALGTSAVASATQFVVETAVGSALGDAEPGARMATRLASSPATTMESMQQLIENPRIRGLVDDDLFWSYVSHESYDAALNRASFLGIAYDETLRRQLGDLGLVTEDQATDARLFRNALRDVLVELGPRLRELREDPEVQTLLHDPALRRALESGDTLALVRHEGVQKLIRRVSQK